jgi:Tol biopolymer transport system component
MLTTSRLARVLLCVTIISASASQLLAQNFGKNKVQYFNQDWSYLQSEHFDVYFYQDGYEVARFVIQTAEDALKQICASYNYTLQDRVSIITYQSHNAFQSTNVVFESPEEGVGGFTEFFKNRVVIPYEGSYEQLRHVTHHELSHAVMMEMIYGGGITSVFSALSRLPIPTWFVEGLAEYESRHGWDSDSDLFMRDATVNDYLPPIDNLGGFLNYKGGQSILYYISQRYGEEKIGELLHRIKSARDVDRGFKLALGIGIEDLSKRWHRWLKNSYWPTVASLQDPEDIARRLTDHRKDRNFINNSPALSPDGTQLAYLSDRSDYFDIYLMDVVEGKIKKKLVSGETSAKFEELHWLRPGLTWSPDGKNIAFAAKAGKSDAIHILNVEKSKITRTYRFELNGVFSPAYSPDGSSIAFVGTQAGHSDIYSVDLASGELSQITHDVFSDMDPSWSPDGTKIAFTSDRGDYVGQPPDDFDISTFNYHQTDVFIVDIKSRSLERVTNTKENERTPEWSPKEELLSYVSDRDGVYNLYLHDFNSNDTYAITNLLTGCFQPTWSNKGELAFSSLFDAGYDIFYLRDPFDTKLRRYPLEVIPSPFSHPLPPEPKTEEKLESAGLQTPSPATSSTRVVFDDLYQSDEIKQSVFLDSSAYIAEDGKYKVNKYKVHFSPDVVAATAGFSTFFGLQANGQILLSDMLGNNQIYLGLNVYSDISNTNAQVIYMYQPHRINYGIGGHHYAYFFYLYDPLQNTKTYFRDRHFGLDIFAQYPFSRYSRLEGTLSILGINRESYSWVYDQYQYREKRRVILPGLAYVHDTILWGSTGPTNGMRARLALYVSPDLESHIKTNGAQGWGLDFQTVTLDVRKYLKVGHDLTLAVRASGGFSEGPNPEPFFVGGEENWINPRFKGSIKGDIEDLYFSNWVTPFRGGDYYSAQGTRFGLGNVEFRFPLIQHLVLGWPLPIHLADIRGAIFSDLAGAWDKDNFRGTVKVGDSTSLNDLMMSMGLGTRLNLGYFVLRWDVAWRTYWNHTDSPRYYVSLGAEY